MASEPVPPPEKDAPLPKGKNPVEERLVKQWKLLVPAVTWVMAVIGSFWLPAPPGLVTGDTKMMVSFARYVATISTGLMVLPTLKWCPCRVHAWPWGKVAAAAALLSVGLFFAYLHLEEQWTVRHGDQVLYVGTEARPEVAEFVRLHPDKRELLASAGWDPSRVWTERSIERCRLTLSSMYVLGVPLFVVALVAVAQVVCCAGRTEE